MKNQFENVENMSKEELLELISASGLDVKALAANAKLFKTNGSVEKEKTSKKSNIVRWEVALDDHGDWAIKKTTAKKWKMFVCMTSQGTFFFQDSDGQITAVDAKSLNSFTRGMPTLYFPNSWVKELSEGDIREKEKLITFMETPELMEMAKFGCEPSWREGGGNSYYRAYLHRNYISAWNLVPNLMKKYHDNKKILTFIVAAPATLIDMKERWGIDNVYAFLEEYDKSLVNLYPEELHYKDKIIDNYTWAGHTEEASSSLPGINMDFKAFKDFFLYDSYRIGYAENPKKFFDTWRDTIRMQNDVYGKVKYKYPDNLQCLHDFLSYQYSIMKQEIDKVKFARQAAKAKKYEAEVDKYVFIAPTKKEDFLDEAEQQQNCLASYINKFTNGEDIIMFMRFKDKPEESLVTIELINGEVVQKYGYRNRAVTEEEDEAINKWLKSRTKKATK